MTDTDPGKVIVTFAEVERIFTGREALEGLAETAVKTSGVDRAKVMAGVGNVLRELRRAEDKANAKVLSTPHHGPSARLQSLIASGELGELKLQPLPTGGLEAQFDTKDWFGWASVAWARLTNPINHPLLRTKKAAAEPLPDEARIAVLGDWGTGLYGAPLVAKAIRGDVQGFQLLLHLGDVYYSGSANEIQARFLSGWPKVSGATSRALNSNHEMYSGGHPYFTTTLPAFAQEASYFAFQSSHWTLVGLDVAYKDHDIDDEQVGWLREIIAKAGDRRIILFSHHQLFSSFEGQGRKLLSHPGFRQVLDSKRIFAWYWGHEHRCLLFDEPDPQFGILARCIGHSGMPQSRAATTALPRASGKSWDLADWRVAARREDTGLIIPSAKVLEGPNKFIIGEEEKFSPHGYAVLSIEGRRLTEQVCDADGGVIYQRELAS